MTIYKDKQFLISLEQILDYIAKDGLEYAISFNKKLQKSIESIPNFPYKSRKSLYHNNENVRDYIFKGYTIPYLIDIQNQKIVLLDIFKWVDRQDYNY
jgi:plasmid stabilization system protein ParE